MKKLFAILLTVSMLVAFAACGNKPAEEPKSEEVETEAVAEEVTAAEGEEVAEPQSEIDPAESATEATSEEATEATSEEATTEAEEIKAPETKEEILALYNDAVNGAYAAKAGFKKERYTDGEQFDLSVALKAFKSLVEKFVGIGEDNKYTETVEKGKWSDDSKKAYLRKSTLTAGDITDAKCTPSDDGYTLVISVKGGNSVGNKDTSKTNAPIDKCGICVGNEDKGYYDHKTGPVIYDAIGGTYAGAKIDEKYSNAKITAKIGKDGKITSLKVEFLITVAIDIGIGSGTASGTTHIIYKDIKY